MSTSVTDLSSAGSPTVSRRTVMKGAAWAVPAIALATAAPAFATSLIPVYGKLYESSFQCAPTHIGLSSAFPGDCEYDGVTSAMVTMTFTIAYSGDADDFTFANAVIKDLDLWNVSLSDDGHTLTLVNAHPVELRCMAGMDTHIDVTLDGASAPMTPKSILVSCSGVDADGKTVITGIVDAGVSKNGLAKGDPLVGTTAGSTV